MAPPSRVEIGSAAARLAPGVLGLRVRDQRRPPGRRLLRDLGPAADRSGARLCGYRGVVREITAEREIGKALAERSALPGQLRERPVGIASIDPGGWVEVNNTLCALLGYRRQPLLERSFESITHPADRTACRDAMAQLTSGEGNNFLIEMRLLHRDGKDRWVRLHATLLRDRVGAPDVFLFVFENITERVAAMRALHASELLYRRLVDLSPDGIFLHREGRLILANPACVRLLGAGEERNLLGRSVLELVMDEDKPKISMRVAELQAAAGDGTATPLQVFSYRRLDSAPVQAESTEVSVMLEDGPAVLCVLRDIRDRLEAEKSLRESDARYRDVVESVNEVISARSSGTLQLPQQGLGERLGFGVEESMGSPLLEFLHPDDREKLTRRIANMQGSRGEPCEAEFAFVPPTARSAGSRPRPARSTPTSPAAAASGLARRYLVAQDRRTHPQEPQPGTRKPGPGAYRRTRGIQPRTRGVLLFGFTRPAGPAARDRRLCPCAGGGFRHAARCHRLPVPEADQGREQPHGEPHRRPARAGAIDPADIAQGDGRPESADLANRRGASRRDTVAIHRPRGHAGPGGPGRPHSDSGGTREPLAQRLEVHRRQASCQDPLFSPSVARTSSPTAWPTTASVSTWTTLPSCSSLSSAFTARTSTKVRGSAWQPYSGSSSVTGRNMGGINARKRGSLLFHAQLTNVCVIDGRFRHSPVIYVKLWVVQRNIIFEH